MSHLLLPVEQLAGSLIILERGRQLQSLYEIHAFPNLPELHGWGSIDNLVRGGVGLEAAVQDPVQHGPKRDAQPMRVVAKSLQKRVVDIYRGAHIMMLTHHLRDAKAHCMNDV